MKLKEGTGRVVSKAAHDERFLKIPETLSLVESAELYDSLHIYARNIFIDHSSLTEGIQLVAKNPTHGVQVFREEIERQWPDKLKTYFDHRVKEVMSLKQSRGASKEEIIAFKEQLNSEIKVKWPNFVYKQNTNHAQKQTDVDERVKRVQA